MFEFLKKWKKKKKLVEPETIDPAVTAAMRWSALAKLPSEEPKIEKELHDCILVLKTILTSYDSLLESSKQYPTTAQSGTCYITFYERSGTGKTLDKAIERLWRKMFGFLTNKDLYFNSTDLRLETGKLYKPTMKLTALYHYSHRDKGMEMFSDDTVFMCMGTLDDFPNPCNFSADYYILMTDANLYMVPTTSQIPELKIFEQVTQKT